MSNYQLRAHTLISRSKQLETFPKRMIDTGTGLFKVVAMS